MSALRGQVALITGAGSGLGEAIARRFVAEGASVALADIRGDSAERVARESGPLAGARAVDVQLPEQVEAWVREVGEALGTPTILICAAAVLRDARLGDMTDADWDLVVNTSLRGTFNCLRAVAPIMGEAGYGRIVTFASISHRGNFGQANYAAAKAGIVGLTRTTALEFAAKGVTANIISPGPIDTPMLQALTEETRARLIRRVPVRRAGLPEEIAAAAAFLCGREAGYVTGVVLDVDGGYGIGASLR